MSEEKNQNFWTKDNPSEEGLYPAKFEAYSTNVCRITVLLVCKDEDIDEDAWCAYEPGSENPYILDEVYEWGQRLEFR